jgi:3-oxoadipate enol-lactonase
MPTVVVHGRDDLVVPVRNAEILTDRIPAARLQILHDVWHLYTTEEPDVDRTISDFLAEATD